MFSELSDAPPCQQNSCDNSNICNIQLRNAPVSNMLPCCVSPVTGPSVCQCVIALPDSQNQLTMCPNSELKLVSNQIFNMSGISRFFTVKVPVCGSLFSSWNIYKGNGPPIKTDAAPFVKNSVRLH